MRFFGISLGTILLVVLVAVAVRMWGSKVPFLNTLAAG